MFETDKLLNVTLSFKYFNKYELKCIICSFCF